MKVLGIIGSAGLFLAVALGAFGAHALRDHLSERMHEVFETGVKYQMYHSLAILLTAVMAGQGRFFPMAGAFYTAGILLFSFSLYALAVTGIRWLGAITPLGGTCFLIGHALLMIAFYRMNSAS